MFYVRKHPPALADATKAYVEATSSSVCFLIAENEQMAKELHTIVSRDSVTIYLSKPPVYDDLPDDEVETPKTVKALQPELMVMLGGHYPKDGFASDQEIVETPKAPHHSSICIEDQSHT